MIRNKLREFRHLYRIQPGDRATFGETPAMVFSVYPGRVPLTRKIELQFIGTDYRKTVPEWSLRLESVKPIGLSLNREWRFK